MMNDPLDSDNRLFDPENGSQTLPRNPLLRALDALAVGSIAIGLAGSLGAWMGGASLVGIAGCAAGIFAGLGLCTAMKLGFAFGDRRQEAMRCIAIATASGVLFYLVQTYLPWLMGFDLAPRYCLVPIVQYFLILSAWQELQKEEVLITLICADAIAWVGYGFTGP